MTRSLGIDLGSYSIKLAEVNYEGSDAEILGLYELPLKDGQNPSESLREFLETHAVAPQRITSNIGRIPVLIKRMYYPFGDRKRVEQAVLAEYEDQVPYDLDEYHLEYSHLGKSGKSHVFMSALCPKELLNQHNELFENSGLAPNAYGLDNDALARLAIHQNKSEAQRVVCLIDLGFKSTKIAIFREADPKSKLKDLSQNILELRTINKGCIEIFDWMDSHKNMSSDDIEQWLLHRARIKNNEGAAETHVSDETSDDIKTALKPILVEIYQTFQSLRSKQGIFPEHILLTGGIARLEGLSEFLSKELRMEVRPWNCLSNFNSARIENSPLGAERFALALALADRFRPSKMPAPFNFRRSSLADKKPLSSYVDAFGNDESQPILKALLFVWLAFIGYQQISAVLVEKEAEKVTKELIALMRQVDPVLGKRAPDLLEEVPRAREFFEKEAERKLKNINPGRRSKSDLLLDVSQSMPAEFKVSDFKAADGRGGSAVITLEIEADPVLAKERRSALTQELTQALEKKGYSSIQSKESANRIRFEAQYVEAQL